MAIRVDKDGPPARTRPKGEDMSAEDLPAAPDGDQDEKLIEAEEEFVEAQVFQREMDHPEEFHNPLVDSLLGNEDEPEVPVPDDEPLIVAEDEYIEGQVYSTQMNAAEDEYLRTHPKAK